MIYLCRTAPHTQATLAMAPAKTDPLIVDQTNREIASIVQSTDTKQYFVNLGIDEVDSTAVRLFLKNQRVMQINWET